MIKRLRIRFVCITMAIVTVMLGAIFGLLYGSTRAQLEEESLNAMRLIAASPLSSARPGGSGAGIPFFAIETNLLGEVMAVNGGSFDLSDEDMLRALLETAFAGQEEYGVIEGYHLRYYRASTLTGQCVVFADISGEIATLRSLTRTSLFIGAAALAIFLLISVLLARWAVRPTERAWAQQRQFISDASHELKTPLSVIMTNAEMLTLPEYGAEEKAAFAGNILSMSHRMRHLVEGLLELARMDSGAAAAAFRPVDMGRLTEDALLPFEPVFFEKGLELSADIQKDLTVSGQEQQLRQVVDILLDNAAKYASSPGAVRVTLSQKGRGRCLLEVADTGPAIPPEELGRLFDRFYRSDAARSDGHSYGLGLAIARSIVAEHRGRIWAESAGGENRFLVELPAQE